MGLRRVLFLAEVSVLPSKSQDSTSDLVVADLEVKSREVSPAVSGHTDSKTDLAGVRHVATSRYTAPRNLCRFGFRSHATASAVLQHPVLSLGLQSHHHNNLLSHHMGWTGLRQRRVPSVPPTIYCGNRSSCLLIGAHDSGTVTEASGTIPFVAPL
jgi:hypothetical protein